MGWSRDISAAPRGRYALRAASNGRGHIRKFEPAPVILATKCGKVTVSHYIPDQKRWLMLHDGEQPVAWHPWAGETKAAQLPTYPEGVAP